MSTHNFTTKRQAHKSCEIESQTDAIHDLVLLAAQLERVKGSPTIVCLW